MSGKRPHLFITEQLPLQKDREFTNAGGGGTYLRTSYQQHANKIYEEAALLKQEFEQATELNKISKRYFRVELPEEQTAWSSAGKKLEKDILANIVGSPEKNIAHVSTNISSFDLLVEQLSNYQNSKNHSGKSKFAALENISSIPLSEKITNRLKRQWGSEDFFGEVLISLFSDLTNEERETYKIAIETFLQHCKSYLRTKLCKKNPQGELVSVTPGNSLDIITDSYATVVRRDNQFSKELSHGDWELVVEQVSRWTLKDPNTRYGVAITISDPRRESGIDIAAMLQNEVPNRYSTQVNIREHIRL